MYKESVQEIISWHLLSLCKKTLKKIKGCALEKDAFSCKHYLKKSE